MQDYGSFRRHISAVPLEGVMLVGAAVMLSQSNWKHLLVSLFTFTVSFAPLWLERLLKVRLPATFQFLYVAFIFCSMFAGEVLRFYANVPGWDGWIHLISGLFIGFGAVLWIRRLLQNKMRVRLPNWLQLLFVLLVGMSVALAWEIVEYASDRWFGTHSQDDSLLDTMEDLVTGTFGAAFLTSLYALSLKGTNIPILSRAITLFERLNK